MALLYFYAATSVTAFLFVAFAMNPTHRGIMAEILIGLMSAVFWPLFVLRVIIDEEDRN